VTGDVNISLAPPGANNPIVTRFFGAVNNIE